VAQKAAKYLKRPLENLNLITIHLGNGASMTAVKNGNSIDTTMGMTPLDGLVMGTRCGEIDPAIHFFLANHLNMTLDAIDRLLNKKSGLLGICGTNDMREVIKKKDQGDKKAELALKIYTTRIKKYIGAFFAELETLDCIIFTGGIGENSSEIRSSSCAGLHMLGIDLDNHRNQKSCNMVHEISKMNSKIKILVISTNEELMIAKAVVDILKQT
jgi:acetate kinase